MVRLATRQPQRAPRWALPRPFHRILKGALQNAGIGIGLEPELRRAIRRILDSPDITRVSHDELMSSLRLALVEAAIELGFPPGAERNELLTRMVAVCQHELHEVKRPW
jgi:hypothetical protein